MEKLLKLKELVGAILAVLFAFAWLYSWVKKTDSEIEYMYKRFEAMEARIQNLENTDNTIISRMSNVDINFAKIDGKIDNLTEKIDLWIKFMQKKKD
jgi:hypothetical protein